MSGASLEDCSAREKDGGPHGGKQVNVWGDTDEDKREGCDKKEKRGGMGGEEERKGDW